MTPQEIYALFQSKKGATNLADLATIGAVISYCRKNNPRTVLELGGGIGTLSYSVLKNSNATLDIYEHNDFCVGALNENLKDYKGRFTIIPNYLTLPPRREYDLVIVDGGKGKNEHDGGFSLAIAAYLSSLTSLKTIIVEGQRKSQRYWAVEAIRSRYLYKPTKYKDPSGGKRGSLRIDCKPCSSEVLRLANHWYWGSRIY